MKFVLKVLGFLLDSEEIIHNIGTIYWTVIIIKLCAEII